MSCIPWIPYIFRFLKNMEIRVYLEKSGDMQKYGFYFVRESCLA